MARIYDKNGKIVGTTESKDIRLNEANELYESDNLDGALVELSKVFDIEEEQKITNGLLGYDEEKQELTRALTVDDFFNLKAQPFFLKSWNDGTESFSITIDDITILGKATVEFDETNMTLKIKSTGTSGYQGIRINRHFSISDKEIICLGVEFKNNLNGYINFGGMYVYNDDYYEVRREGYKYYEKHTDYNSNSNYIEITGGYGKPIDIEIIDLGFYIMGKVANNIDLRNLEQKSYKLNEKISNVDSKIVQPDWNETDETSLAYIKNKPSMSSDGSLDLSSYQTKTDNTLTTTDKTIVGAINEVKSSVPTNTSDLTNDSGFTTKTYVDDNFATVDSPCFMNSISLGANLLITQGKNGLATGYFTHAKGQNSQAFGENTRASSKNQHVQGKNNIEDSTGTYAHIVGNGTSTSAKSNAHTLDWNGNAWYAGDVYVGGTSQTDGNKLLSTADIHFNEAGELVITINGVTKTFVPKSE